ncbi:hypothetical protein D3C77_558890 [compost metagenome]
MFVQTVKVCGWIVASLRSCLVKFVNYALPLMSGMTAVKVDRHITATTSNIVSLGQAMIPEGVLGHRSKAMILVTMDINITKTLTNIRRKSLCLMY